MIGSSYHGQRTEDIMSEFEEHTVQFIGLIPRRMMVTCGGQTDLIDLTPEETEIYLEHRDCADAAAGALILGARLKRRAAS